jgi:hypothetical protein
MISCLLTSSTSTSPPRSAHCEQVCEGLGLQVGASMMCCKYLSNTALASSSLEILSEGENKELIWPEVEQCR